MSDIERLLGYWRAQDALFQRVSPTPWGAIVSDDRYPDIQEPNYARVDTRGPVGLTEVEAALLPAMARSGSARSHVVVFHPQEQTDLISEASTRGERISWELVMASQDAPPADYGLPEDDPSVEEIHEFDEPFWRAHAASIGLFAVDEQPAVDQLQAIEREVLIPGGRRWLTVREDGRPVAFAALLVLEGQGYLDHVVTFPAARRRGHAGALTRRALAEARAAGARSTFLLADPGGPAERIYARLGFRRAGHIASWLSPIRT